MVSEGPVLSVTAELRYEAQNEHMVDQHFTHLGKLLNKAADYIDMLESMSRDRAESKADAYARMLSEENNEK